MFDFGPTPKWLDFLAFNVLAFVGWLYIEFAHWLLSNIHFTFGK